jgi:alpha-galactosidase
MPHKMKKYILLFIITFVLGTPLYAQIPRQAANSAELKLWEKQLFAKGKIPPFSFTYGGSSSKNFISKWHYTAQDEPGNEPNIQKKSYTYIDPKTKLQVKCQVTLFLDFNAIEWVLNFKNLSAGNTPLIEKVNAIDYTFIEKTDSKFILHHSNGSDGKINDFEPFDDELQANKKVYMTPAGGRSSDNTAFPFFNLETEGKKGVMVAVGWTGKWFADLEKTTPKSVTLKSGMERMKLLLYSNEEIRTPKICLLFWKGNDRMIGHNQFRQFVLAHHTRQVDGKPQVLPLAAGLAGNGPAPCNEFTCATEEYSIATINRFKQFNITPEVFWTDAGWYARDNGRWEQVGNWVPNQNFPNGFKPVSDAAHKVGAKYILWFEPERFDKRVDLLPGEKKEWLISNGSVKGNNLLFNLGNTEARQWLSNYLIKFTKDNGVDYYRQDFNFDPMPYWEKMDQPDRVGIAEIRHIEGLYAFWDSLLANFPNMIIDNCASGGRRLDLETISRSAPLWRTDYKYGEPNGAQSHTYGLNFYLPLHGTGNFSTSPYDFYSAMSSALIVNWDINNAKSQKQLQKFINNYKMLRPYFYGDYYPLTGKENLSSDQIWLAYQLNRPDKADGIVVAFRRPGATGTSINVKLHGLNKASKYTLTDVDSGKTIIITGQELAAGSDIVITTQPGAVVMQYVESK